MRVLFLMTVMMVVGSSAFAKARHRPVKATSGSPVESAIERGDASAALEGIEAIARAGGARNRANAALLSRLLLRAGNRGVECSEPVVSRLVELGASVKVNDVMGHLDTAIGCAPFIRFVFRDASSSSRLRVAMAAAYVFPQHIAKWRSQLESDPSRAGSSLEALSESFRFVVEDLQMQCSSSSNASVVLDHYLGIKREIDESIAKLGGSCADSDGDCVANRERVAGPLRRFL